MLRIASLIFTILLIYISLYFVTIRLDMHYKYINRDLVGIELDNIKSILGYSYTYDFGEKGFVGFPYKSYESACGRGYSLTIYYDEARVISNVSNKVFYMCNGYKLLSKEIIYSKDNIIERIIVWPFINYDRYR